MSEERRAPVQRNDRLNKPGGTIAWWEHEKAWAAYAKLYGNGQSAERIAERHGFCYGEVTEFLGHEPETFKTHQREGLDT